MAIVARGEGEIPAETGDGGNLAASGGLPPSADKQGHYFDATVARSINR